MSEYSLNGAQATLEDLGSKNATSLSGQRIPVPTLLADGDGLRLGRVTMTPRALRPNAARRTDDG